MTASLSKARILVIDDYQGMRTMLGNFVRAMGVTQVNSAGNGPDALNQLRQNTFDIVICDYNLGIGQNGQQVLDEARMRNYIGISTIWVMVTAEKTTDMVMGAAEVKPDDYLLKPINQSLLQSRLEKLIVRKQSLVGIETAIKAKDYAAAIASCDLQLSAQTSNPQEILRIKSDLLLQIGDYNAARELFESILVVRNIPWARTGLGKVLFYAGDYEAAKLIFQQVLQENRMYMEASDWLVKALDALGDSRQAQQVLQEAVKLSPNSPVRQKNLGDTAYKNGDLDIAQKAFETTVKISEFSSHKSPAIYSGLAKVLTDKHVPDEALKVLARSKATFKGNIEATIQTAAVESTVYGSMGLTDKAEAAMATAADLMSQLPGKVSTEVAMEMAQSMLKIGKKEQAFELLSDLVKNNHENLEISRQVANVFESVNMKEEGQALIQESRQEVININNQGVLLAKKGEYQEGAKLLRTAVQNLPNSEVVIMNLCGLLIGQMTKEGRNDATIREVKSLLDRVKEINPANKKYSTYATALVRIASGR